MKDNFLRKTIILINYICFTNSSGYSFAAKNYIYALLSQNIPLTINPIDLAFIKQVNPCNYNYLNSLISRKFNVNDIQIYHCIPEWQKEKKKSYKTIGFFTFENEYRIENKWIDILNKNTAVITPSLFNYNLIKNKIKVPVFHIPHCLDFDKYNIKIKSNTENQNFRFLFLGTFHKRKGYDILVKAFLEEFANDEKVELILKTYKKGNLDPESWLRTINHKNKIKLDLRLLSDDEMPNYISSFDCLSIISLGEGFMIPGLQALSLGVPLLTTNITGQVDYVTENNSFLINPINWVKKDMDGLYQFVNCNWPEFDIIDIRKNMKEIVNNKAIRDKKAIQGYNDVKDRFNIIETGKKLKLLIDSL